MAKKTPKKRTTNAPSKYPHYTLACEALLVKEVFRPAVMEILSGPGAKSLSHLHTALQHYLKMSISTAAFARFMRAMPDVKTLFTRTDVIRLQGNLIAPQAPHIPQITEDDDGLTEGLPPPPVGNEPSEVAPKPLPWDLSNMGIPGMDDRTVLR